MNWAGGGRDDLRQPHRLAVAAAVPLILATVPRVPVPGPVLEIAAGIVLGPAVLDLVKGAQVIL